LFAVSTPWSASSFFAEQIRKYQNGNNPEIYCLVADTLTMNPLFSRRVIDRAYEDDPIAAQSEYGAQFRSDLESFISREVIEACTIHGRYELPPAKDFRYFAFADPSGGSSDSFTIAISHGENGVAVLDCVREIRPPFSPEKATKELASTLIAYEITKVTGDKYGGLWPGDEFCKNGIRYEPSEKSKSEIYLELLPLLNSRRVELLENRKLIAQLSGLERRTRAGGRDAVDHIPGGHDDLINSAAGAILIASERARAKDAAANFIRQANSGNLSIGTRPNYTSDPNYANNVRPNRTAIFEKYFGRSGSDSNTTAWGSKCSEGSRPVQKPPSWWRDD
jgi:hypothetical protein